MAGRASSNEECTEPLVVLREEARLAWRIIVCAIYIGWWRAKHYITSDDRIHKGAKWAAIPSALLFLVEVVLSIFRVELSIWLHAATLVVLMPAALVLVLHRVKEALAKGTESSFSANIGPIVDALGNAAIAPRENQREALDTFVETLLEHIHEHLKERTPVHVNVMFPDQYGNLKIVYLYPVGTIYDPDFSLKPGEGAAGYSFEKAKIVYVPAIQYAHGILVTFPESEDGPNAEISFGLKPRLYIQIAAEFEIFASIVSLPITSPLGKHAVLNVDSNRPDGFNFQDINILRAYARVLGNGISACSR